MAARKPKKDTFPIPRVLMVRMSRKEAIVDAIYVDNKGNFKWWVREQSGS